jgi:DNA-binding PadR family transcriptional regulator
MGIKKKRESSTRVEITMLQGMFRGSLPWFLMRLLQSGPKYGLDMIRIIAEHTEGTWKPSAGSVYPVLRNLEEQGLIDGDWSRTKAAPRRIYRLTAKGKREIPKMRQQMIDQCTVALETMAAHVEALKAEGDEVHHLPAD